MRTASADGDPLESSLFTGFCGHHRGGHRMRARVFVTLKPSVFDPQGKVIADALHSLGYGGVHDVRQGKYFELDLATTEAAQAQALAAEVADKQLANPVIESYRIEID
jgi:phosphoribosylformylglycinamidine synthase PurS subunit